VEIINNTPFEVAALPLPGPENKPSLTVIVKGSFAFETDGSVTEAEEQIPVAFGDEFNDEENGGSVKFESDVAPFKPNADIVLVGSAHTPEGQMVQGIDVSLRVGQLQKVIRVLGDRHWNVVSSWLQESASIPEPFSKMDLVYERAFGGIDMEGGGYCKENLAGKGFYAKKSKKAVKDLPLPNLEDPSNMIKSRKDCPKPVGFGFYGQAWEPRLGYLGTYDEKWKKERSPAPPEDFSFAFYNAAHPDLILDGYLKGDEEVGLRNLSPDGDVRLKLPGITVKCFVTKALEKEGSDSQSLEDEETDEMENEFTDDDAGDEAAFDDFDVDEDALYGSKEEVLLNLDTLCMIPDEKRFYLVWRGTCPMKDLDPGEIMRIEVGRKSVNLSPET